MTSVEIKIKVRRTIWFYIVFLGTKIANKIADKPLMKGYINGKKQLIVKLSDMNFKNG